MKSTKIEYGRIAQLFHWSSMLLIFTLLPIGIIMTRMADGASKNGLYRLHVTIGLIVSALTILRVLWRFLDPTPDVPPGLSPAREFVFKAIHVLLYIFLFVMAVSGIAMLLFSDLGISPKNVSPEAIARDIPPLITHGIVSKLYIALLIAHIGGVLQYQFTKSDVLYRMGLKGLPSKQ